MTRLTYVTALFFLASTVSAFAAVTVSTPANGASVATPFTVTADASSCSSQTVSAMGYSLDNSSDTTTVQGTTLNASVPAATGAHTLHVKAWGNQGAACVTDVAITVTGAAASSGVTISSPANGATLTSPFTLSGASSTCDGQPVATMAYEVDSAADSPAVNGTSLTASISAAAGSHVVQLKSWGNKGAGCAASVNVTVNGSSGSTGSTEGISVSSPASGATVGSPFALSAGASTCSGQSVSAMGYSLDSSSSTTTVNGASLQASISAAAGAHTLNVKSWGNEGAGCVAKIPITVSGATASPDTASSAAEGITVSSPANGATVDSSFDVVASAASCDSQPVTAVGYSLDSSSDTTTFSGTSMDAAATAGSGAHTLHVKSWGDQGAGCVDNVAITVSGGTAAATSTIPSDAVSVSSIETLSNWEQADDGGTTGTASGSMSLVTSPSLQGDSRDFVTHFTNGGGERYYVSFGDDTSSTNFFYDAWVYLTSSSSQIANIEMDMNQTMPNGQTAIFGFQCDGYNGVWDYTKNAGSPASPTDTWVHSAAPCNPRSWGANAWHHVQVSYSRDSSGNVTYHSVWLDGTEQAINATVPSAFALGWAPALVTNFQVDGLGSSGAPTVYLDELTVYRW